MKATVTWQHDMQFKCDTDSGHSVVLDGDGNALSPMESVLLSVGACSSVDVVEILKKARQPIVGCVCQLRAERAESPPRVFTAIHAHYHVTGESLSEKHVARAVSLSAEKYCSVIKMLEASVEISTDFTIGSSLSSS